MRKRNAKQLGDVLAETLEGATIQFAYQLWRAEKTGAWLTVHLSALNGTELGVK